MARPTRIEFAGAHYHVFARGDRKDNIFLCSYDYQKFLQKLKETLVKFNVDCVAYALMPNHYHLYLVTNEPNLTQTMHYLNTSYTNWFKRKHEIVGHVFQGRYKALLIDKDEYMDRVIDYIHLNPVKSGIEELPWNYKWSSCKSYCSGKDHHEIISMDLYFRLSNLDFKDYKQHIFKSKNYDLPHRNLYKSVAIGSDEFKKNVEDKMNNKDENYYEPSTKMHYTRDYKNILNIIAEYFEISEKIILKNFYRNHYKKYFIFFLKKYTRLKNADIADIYKIKESAITQIFRRFVLDINKSNEIKSHIKKIECKLCRPDPK